MGLSPETHVQFGCVNSCCINWWMKSESSHFIYIQKPHNVWVFCIISHVYAPKCLYISVYIRLCTFIIIPWTFHTLVAVASSHSEAPLVPLWPLRPPGPCELLTKSPQYYSNNRPRDKEHIYTSGLSLKAKRHCLEDFQAPLPRKTRAPFAPQHPTSRFLRLEKVHHSSDGDVGAKYTTPSPIPPANPQAPPI